MNDLIDRLEEARQKRGQAPEEVCVVLKVSRYTLDNWKAGRTTPSPAQRELIEQYIRGER